jgi:hypothetical protein
MDCSIRAATVHLNAATDSLQTIAGGSFHDLVLALERAYSTLTPPQTIVRTTVSQETGAAIRAVQFRRLVRRAVILLVLASIGYAVWRWHPILLQWLEAVRSRVQTQST